jgi:hypothetical protein
MARRMPRCFVERAVTMARNRTGSAAIMTGNRRSIHGCAYAALVVCGAGAGAAQYTVAPGGSDANAGTAAAPWATLQHAADRVGAGDTVNVLPGTYQGFDLRTSGAPGSPITFRAEPGATIDAVNSTTNDGINIENASWVTIEGFTLTSPGAGTRAGIRVVGDGFDQADAFSAHVTLRNNTASGWGRWGIFTGFVDDLLIEGNTLSGSILEHGLYVSNSGDRPVIRNNHVFDNRANGIHINGDINTGNTALPGVDGIVTGALVEGNVIHGNGAGGGSGITADGAVGALIQNNLLYDNHASGISLYQIDGGAPSTGGVIVNNTIINAGNARWVVNLANGASGATVFNNILFNLNTSSLRGAITATDGSDAGLVSNYNLLDPRFDRDDSNAIGLASWQAQTGQDLDSVALSLADLEALFVAYAANDFRLAEASAARDFGVAGLGNGGLFVGAPLRDLLGAIRPAGGSHDAGAFELAPVPLPPALALLAAALLPLGSMARRG